MVLKKRDKDTPGTKKPKTKGSNKEDKGKVNSNSFLNFYI